MKFTIINIIIIILLMDEAQPILFSMFDCSQSIILGMTHEWDT